MSRLPSRILPPSKPMRSKSKPYLRMYGAFALQLLQDTKPAGSRRETEEKKQKEQSREVGESEEAFYIRIGGGRIQFDTVRVGNCSPALTTHPEVSALCRAMEAMEACGAAPLFPDGGVGGNGAVRLPGSDHSVMVSRSKKPPGHIANTDLVQVTDFSRRRWQASFNTPPDFPTHKPSSDSPLLWHALMDGMTRYGWEKQPRAALHGHSIETEEAAAACGVPISLEETRFSTPADLDALEGLLIAHPYPRTTVYVRRGHGFFILGEDVAHCMRSFRLIIKPYMDRMAAKAPARHR